MSSEMYDLKENLMPLKHICTAHSMHSSLIYMVHLLLQLPQALVPTYHPAKSVRMKGRLFWIGGTYVCQELLLIIK